MFERYNIIESMLFRKITIGRIKMLYFDSHALFCYNEARACRSILYLEARIRFQGTAKKDAGRLVP